MTSYTELTTATFSQHCERCAASLPNDALFCTECGAAVMPPTQAATGVTEVLAPRSAPSILPQVAAFQRTFAYCVGAVLLLGVGVVLMHLVGAWLILVVAVLAYLLLDAIRTR